MKSPLHLASFVLALALGAGCSVLATHASSAHADTTGADTVTVFVDATLGFRKDHMAKQLTESHTEMAARGYRFADMAAFNENGDFEGFFVTYVRD